MFFSFPALLLRKKLQDLLDQKGCRELEWADIVHDLDQMIEMEIRLSGKDYVLHSEVNGSAGKVFQAAGVAIPPKLVQK